MGYRKRVRVKGGLYKVTSEACSGQLFFRDEFDYAAFLWLVIAYKREMPFKVYGYCLAPRRVEMVLAVKTSTATKVMHRVLMMYARYYNRRYGLRGHLVSRVHTQVYCWDDETLKEALQGIEMLPVRGGLVRQPWEWFWCGFGERVPPRKRLILDDFSDGDSLHKRPWLTPGQRRFLEAQLGLGSYNDAIRLNDTAPY